MIKVAFKYIDLLVLSMLAIGCAQPKGSGKSSKHVEQQKVETIQYRLDVVAEYPHDITAYTQGLFFHDGQMYESTGQYGSSTLRKVDLQTGIPSQTVSFNEKYFLEGSVVFEGTLYLLTWDSNIVFAYDPETLEYKKAWSYPREGWGITTDGEVLIASEGSSWLYFMDADLKHIRKVQVKLNDGRAVNWLNELEFIDGKIWANVYTTDEIVIINPETGRVEGVVDCRGLLPADMRKPDTDVLNGIAYDPSDGKIYLTGKNWPKLYEVRLIEK